MVAMAGVHSERRRPPIKPKRIYLTWATIYVLVNSLEVACAKTWP